MGNQHLVGAALAMATSLTLFASGDVRACMHGGEWLPDQSVEEVLRAEQQVEKGKYDAAARNVAKSFPRIKKRRIHGSVLGDRALRVMAKVVVRTRGGVDLGSFFPSKSQDEKNDNIEWSVHVLQGLSLKRPNDALAQSALAEAFSLVPGKREDAKRILVDLEKRDLLASPTAYATLARLREGAGRGKPAFVAQPLKTLELGRARVAHARCAMMAEDDAMCEAPRRAAAESAAKDAQGERG